MGRVSDAKPRLLEAAIDLVWSRSYGAVTVDDICEQAGVNKGSFYYFFKSKDELVAAALDAKWDEVRPDFDRIFSPSRPALDRLRDAFEYLYKRQKELHDKHNCVLGCPFSSVGTEIIAADRILRDSVQRMMKAKLRYFESRCAIFRPKANFRTGRTRRSWRGRFTPTMKGRWHRRGSPMTWRCSGDRMMVR